MFSFEIKDTEENVFSTFVKDSIGRDADVLRMVSLLNKIDGSCSIALDGKWGSGKTFFIKQVKMILDAYNSFTNVYDEEKKKQILSASQSKLQIDPVDPVVTVYYDAWANDNDIDPLLSIIYSIIQSTESADLFEKDGAAKMVIEAVTSMTDLLRGTNITSFLESLQNADNFTKIKEEKGLQRRISEFFAALLPEKGNKLIIFIDELDRCKPSFAIQLLERVKHYFLCENVIFVFSVNLSQLQYSVKHFYGEGFDGNTYMNRFFDLSLPLPPADENKYYQEVKLNDTVYVVDKICKEICGHFSFQLRETAKYSFLTKSVAFKISHSDSYSFYSSGFSFAVCCILPIMIGLRIHNIEEYQSFINGENRKYLSILTPELVGSGFARMLLNDGEKYIGDPPDSSLHSVPFDKKMEEVYSAIFSASSKKSNSSVEIGEAHFDKGIKNVLLRMMSELSDFGDIS